MYVYMCIYKCIDYVISPDPSVSISAISVFISSFFGSNPRARKAIYQRISHWISLNTRRYLNILHTSAQFAKYKFLIASD